MQYALVIPGDTVNNSSSTIIQKTNLCWRVLWHSVVISGNAASTWTCKVALPNGKELVLEHYIHAVVNCTSKNLQVHVYLFYILVLSYGCIPASWECCVATLYTMPCVMADDVVVLNTITIMLLLVCLPVSTLLKYLLLTCMWHLGLWVP